MRTGMRTGVVFVLLGLTLMTREAASFDLFAKEDGEVAEGNELLKKGKPKQAMASYNKVPGSLQGNHAVNLNRGLALSRMGDEKIDQAMQAFQKAVDSEAPDAVRARALANLGNAFFKKEDYEEAMKHYKQSLMLAPGNRDIAWNLELAAQRKTQQEQDQQDQKDQDQQNQDQQDQDQQNQEPQNKDQQDQKDQDQQNQDQQNQEPQDQQDKPEPEQKPEPKTKQEVEQLLDSLDKTQENLQKQMAQKRGAVAPSGKFKDW